MKVNLQRLKFMNASRHAKTTVQVEPLAEMFGTTVASCKTVRYN